MFGFFFFFWVFLDISRTCVTVFLCQFQDKKSARGGWDKKRLKFSSMKTIEQINKTKDQLMSAQHLQRGWDDNWLTNPLCLQGVEPCRLCPAPLNSNPPQKLGCCCMKSFQVFFLLPVLNGAVHFQTKTHRNLTLNSECLWTTTTTKSREFLSSEEVYTCPLWRTHRHKHACFIKRGSRLRRRGTDFDSAVSAAV